MAVSDKIKGLIKINKGSYEGLAAHMGIPRQSLHNKLQRDSFYAADLIKMADYFGVALAFIADDGTRVSLDMNDLENKNKNEEAKQ